MSKPVITACAAFGISVIACGGAIAAGESAPRYSMSPAEGGGFIRLDGDTGRMAL